MLTVFTYAFCLDGLGKDFNDLNTTICIGVFLQYNCSFIQKVCS